MAARLPCDVFLMAAGIQPNVDLAQAAGLKVNRGIVVDEAMRTSALDIFAAGDACEFDGQVPGLWAVAVEQAKVAAMNAVGGQVSYDEVVPVTMLKVAGIDLVSVGRIETRSNSEIEIAQQDSEGHGYRKLVIADGRLVGAILLGDPQNMPAVTAAVKDGRDVSQCLDALHAGQWDLLGDGSAQPLRAYQPKWTSVPAPKSQPATQPTPEPKPASRTNSRLYSFRKLIGEACLPADRSRPASRRSSRRDRSSQAKTSRHITPQASEQTEKQPAATVKPLQTRFRTIIFNFRRERDEIDAKR